MSLGASSSRVPLYRPSWTERTFVNSDEAEDALCHDRPGFIMRREILKLIPRKIKRHITHPGDNAQIKGFQELLVYLNKHPGPQRLRRGVAAFFDDTVHLRPHLSQSLLRPANKKHFDEIAMVLITELSTAASSRIVDTDMADGAHTSMSDTVLPSNPTASPQERSRRVSRQCLQPSLNALYQPEYVFQILLLDSRLNAD